MVVMPDSSYNYEAVERYCSVVLWHVTPRTLKIYGMDI